MVLETGQDAPSAQPRVSARPAQPRGYAKGRATRRLVLDEAMALFGEVGYRGASLREIAARCGISHPGLLHHFPTKEALLLAVLEHRDVVDTTEFDFQTVRGVDRLTRMADLVALNETRRGIVELYCVLSAEATAADHPAHDHFVARYVHSVNLCAEGYAQAAEDGALRPGIDPPRAGRQLVALMDGLQVQWLLDPAGVDMAGDVRAHLAGQLVPFGTVPVRAAGPTRRGTTP
ncbi:TetR/AcrR family transcriptional regulator [Cellulomonas hominis]